MPASMTTKPSSIRKGVRSARSEEHGNLVSGTVYLATGKALDGMVTFTHALPKGARFGLILESAEAREAVTHMDGPVHFEIIQASREAAQGVAPDPDASAYEPSAQAQLLARGVKRRNEDLVKAEGAFELEQVRELMNGVTSQAVSKRVREGSVLAVPGPSNRRRYPVIQFLSDGSVVEGLKAVTRAFPSKSPWMLLSFLVNKDSALGGARPIDVLKAGDVARVVESARRIGVQGA